MAITTNALARALSLSCSEGISSHDIIFLQALNHISNWNLFIRHTFHPSLRANVQFVHYILIVIGLLLTRWENYCTRRSGSLAYLQPIQPSSHNDFHDCIKQWHGRIPTTPVKMQTGKRLRSDVNRYGGLAPEMEPHLDLDKSTRHRGSSWICRTWWYISQCRNVLDQQLRFRIRHLLLSDMVRVAAEICT